MALTPFQVGPKKEKKSGWDVVAQVMGMANTAVNVATGVKDLAGKADVPKPPVDPVGPAATPPPLGSQYVPPAAGPMQPGANPMRTPDDVMTRGLRRSQGRVF
jgi:hypothetical protein